MFGVDPGGGGAVDLDLDELQAGDAVFPGQGVKRPVEPGAGPDPAVDRQGELRLRGLELAPEELTAMNQRLAAESLSAQPRDGALLVRAEDRP